MNTSTQLGTALAIAIAASVAGAATGTVAHANPSPAALATGYHDALWALGVIVLLALPVTFALIRGTGRRTMIARSESPKPQTAVAAAK